MFRAAEWALKARSEPPGVFARKHAAVQSERPHRAPRARLSNATLVRLCNFSERAISEMAEIEPDSGHCDGGDLMVMPLPCNRWRQVALAAKGAVEEQTEAQ